MFGGLGFGELILILIIALVIFGPGKLPEVGKALGKSIGEFKGALKKAEDTIKVELEEETKKQEQEKSQDNGENRDNMGVKTKQY